MSASVRMVALIGLVIISCKGIASCSVSNTHDAKLAATHVQDFAINFYKNWSSKNPNKNLVFSPVSVALALALLQNGANGKTSEQILKVLATLGSNVDVTSSYASLQRELQVDKSGTKFTVANGVFPNKSLPINSDYENVMKACFESETETLDYKGNLEESRKKINAWVLEKTMKKIPELFKKGTLREDVLLVLANAVYFKGPWLNPFSSKFTKSLPFSGFGRQQDKQWVPFMHNFGMYGYAETGAVRVLELPYNNTDFSMFILLPTETDGLLKLESDLTGEKFIDLCGKVEEKLANVVLPRFTIRTSFDLKDILTDMGLERMFTNEAEFDRITNSKVPLKIDKALHEAFIKVNENGTEAAAATGVSVVRTSSIVNFLADHPFLYAILHKPTNAVLFVGKVNYAEGG